MVENIGINAGKVWAKLDKTGRMNAKDKNKIDQIYLDLTERIYYDDPDGQIISREELEAFLDFYAGEERRLKEDLPRKRWIMKRFLWSEYHPLPR